MELYYKKKVYHHLYHKFSIINGYCGPVLYNYAIMQLCNFTTGFVEFHLFLVYKRLMNRGINRLVIRRL